MQEGMVFDIQRTSLNDGPGLRTTVFLKGCPLSCVWCHNPESQNPKPEIMFDYEKCVGCGKCVSVCTHHIMENEVHLFNREGCTVCGKCVDVCCKNALEIKGRYYTVDEIVREVIRDKAYYDKSGGGVTFSGGEPLSQPLFLKELLKECHSNNIHTAVETSGYTSKTRLDELLQYVDLFLWDYKVTDDAKKYIGVDNDIILNNLDYVLGKGARVRLRCPIIPGINDNKNHLKAISGLSHKYRFDGIDILPYHNMGVYKSKKLGRDPFDNNFPNMSEEIKLCVSAALKEYGCEEFTI